MTVWAQSWWGRAGWLAAAVSSAAVVSAGTRVDFGHSPSLLVFLAMSGLVPASLYLAILPGLATLAVVARRRQDLGPATSLGLVLGGTGTAGLCAFWAWFVNPALGTPVSLAIIAVAVAAVCAFGFGSTLSRTQLYWPMATAISVELIFLGLAFVQGGLAGQSDAATQSIAVRFWVAPDNKIPLIVANLVASHHPLSGYLFGGWQSSDRPPLQSGIALLEYPLFGNRDIGYQILGTGLQMLWLPALWVLLQVLGFDRRRVLIAVLATSATGAVFLNSVYVWPKMLSGALIVSALAILLSRARGDQWFGSGVVVCVAASLAFLSHGSAAFTLIGMVPAIILVVVRRRAWFEAALAAVAAAILYLPWFAFQRLVDPPGDRLLYWQLAGNIASNVTRRPFFQVLFDQYRGAGFGGIVLDKLGNLAGLVARPDLWVASAADPAWTHSILGVARIAQVTDPICAAGPLLLGALVFTSRRRLRHLAPLRPVVQFLALSAAAWVLVQFGSHDSASIISQGPYAILILLIGVLALCITYLPRRAALLLFGASTAWFVVEWIPGVSFTSAIGFIPGLVIVQKSMALICMLGAAGVVAILIHFFRPDTYRTLWGQVGTKPMAPEPLALIDPPSQARGVSRL